jgi:hypothetical protein
MNFECYYYMAYIYTRKHHKEDSSVWGSSLMKSSVRGRNPRDRLVRGVFPDEKLPFPLVSKGERFMRCMERELYAWRERT